MNKSVLIITPYFAPQSHAAVFRAYKLAKYLPRFGWKPFVLTVDTNYLYNEDCSLLADLPSEMEIATARYVEPTLRGVRMALGGQDRTFAALKQRGSDEPQIPPTNGSERFSGGIARRLYGYVSDSWLQTPDAYWTWRQPALRAARHLIATHDIPIVYTTCLPYTCNQIGLALKNDGLRWIADFRDPPPTYLARMSSQHDRIFLKQRRIERQTVRSADAITVTSSACVMIFRDMYLPHIRCPIEFVPTGLDDDLLAHVLDNGGETPALREPYIVFAGEYLPEYGDQFIEAFALALASEEVRRMGLRLVVVGRRELNEPRMAPALRRLGIEPAVTFLDHMPQPQLYCLIKGAMAGVLNPGTYGHWWTTFAKMVDYVALRLPCLAIVPDPSESRSVLERTRLGVFLDGGPDEAANTLIDFVTGRIQSQKPNDEECRRYLASSQVSSFAQIFERVL